MCIKTKDRSPAPLLIHHKARTACPTQAMSAPSFSFWPQEHRVLAEIMLLQEAAHSYTLEPEPE